MIDTNITHVISQQVLETTAQDMTGKYVWMFIAGLVILIFKSSIEKLAAALFMFVGSDYKEDDVVYVDGKPARIVRVGLTKTVFFIYDVVDGKVVSGNKMVIQNKMLKLQPITLSIRIDATKPIQDLVMVGENLGSIPPNTALMMIMAGNQRYQLYLTADEQKNALVRFIYDKPSAPQNK